MIAPRVSAGAALVPIAALRKALGDTAESGTMSRLIAAGKIVPDGEERVDVVAVLPLYFGELRSELRAGTATAASERVRLARAASSELRLAESRRDLIPNEDAEAVVDAVCGSIVAILSAMPARITRDVPVRRRVEAALYQMQAALARDLKDR